MRPGMAGEGHTRVVPRTQLAGPLRLITVTDEVGRIVRDWTRHSLGPRDVDDPVIADGTVLLRTGGEWDSVVAIAARAGTRLAPIVVFKNSVALWQCSREPLQDGLIECEDWSWLRRQVMIHNPGLDGMLQEVEDQTVPASERATWVTTTHDWTRDVDTAHLADVRARQHKLGTADPVHRLLEVIAYADDEAQARGERGQVEVVLGAGWVSVRDDGRGTDTRFDENGTAIRKPVMATRDVRFFDADPPVLLPDGLPRRGMSAVAAVSAWLIHVNRRRDGAWAQTYRHGVPEADLGVVEPDGTTGTTVCFSDEGPADRDRLAETARGFGHVTVRTARSNPAGRSG